MKESNTGLLIVLEERGGDSHELPASSPHRLIKTLRQQILSEEAAQLSSRWFDRWKAILRGQNRAASLAIVLILLSLSLSFGLGSAFLIRQAEGVGLSKSELVSGLFAASEPDGAIGSVGGGGNTNSRARTLELRS